MFTNATFILPMMAAVVTAVVTGYQYYRSRQLEKEQYERDGERKRRRIVELEARLEELDRRDRQNAARQRRRRAAAGRDASADEKSADERIDELKRKVTDLETDRTCLVCYDKLRCVLFDCSHLVTCGECAAKLEVCPICRSLIKMKKSVPLFN